MQTVTDGAEESVATFGDHLARATKLLHSVRHQAPRPHPGVDPAMYPLMFAVLEGPRRISDLATACYCDISTASRQVAHLADLGLLERLSDPADGRAQLVALSEHGRTLLRELRGRRDAWLIGLLRDWSADDLAAFTAYLERFGDDIAASRTGSVRTTDHPPTTEEPR